MIIRCLTDDDVDSIKHTHAAGSMKYDIPTEKIIGRAVVDEDDTPRICLLSRKTAELYVVMDRDYESPAWRMEALKILIREVKSDLIALGYTDAYAFFGEDVPRSYLRRLMNLGARKMIVTCLHFLKDEI